MAQGSRGKLYQERPESLSAPTIVFYLFWFCIVTFFLLAHIFLQFTIRDMRIEAVRLQDQSEKLTAMEKNLQWEIGKLNQGDRLHEYACTELGLKDVDAVAIERLTVPSHLIARYSTGGRTTGYEEASWAELKYPKGLKEEVGSFIRINEELGAREQTLDAAWKQAVSAREEAKKNKASQAKGGK